MGDWQIERLSRSHDRTSFCCGKPMLDNFIQQLATQYEEKGMGRTYVAVVPGEPKVLGYYSLASGSVAFSLIPEEVSKKLPKHPIPVAHLGRLAVDQKAKGQRLGETLLLDAFKRCQALADQLGIFAVEVHALDEEAKGFYLKYGFKPLQDDPFHLYLSMKTIQQLSLEKL